MSGSGVRLSAPALRVLRVLIADPREQRSGAEMARKARVGSGTLYPLLLRLEQIGWVTSEWENGDPAQLGRPRRRFYRLTPEGYRQAHAVLTELALPMGEEAWAF